MANKQFPDSDQAAPCLRIVIVNYRTPKLTCNCLVSLNRERRSYSNFDCVVVDGGSADDSVQSISTFIDQRQWSDWVQLLPLEVNRGFSYANNQAIHSLVSDPRTDFVMLLNPDTVVHANALKSVVEFMQQHPQAGIVGSQLEDENQQLQSSARRFPGVLSELSHGARLGILDRILARKMLSLPFSSHPERCQWVSGAAMCVRREVFEMIGFLDEGFFLYFEELDFCYRASQADWECWLVPDSRVVHLEGAATDLNNRGKRRPHYWFDSRRHYLLKHHGLFTLLSIDAAWLIGRASLTVRCWLGLGGVLDGEPVSFTRDLLSNDVRSVLTGQAFKVKKLSK